MNTSACISNEKSENCYNLRGNRKIKYYLSDSEDDEIKTTSAKHKNKSVSKNKTEKSCLTSNRKRKNNDNSIDKSRNYGKRIKLDNKKQTEVIKYETDSSSLRHHDKKEHVDDSKVTTALASTHKLNASNEATKSFEATITMTSNLHDICKELEKCAIRLEDDVQKSLQDLAQTNINDNVIILENDKDYHYKEILNNLQQIKENIKKIVHHNQKIHKLQNRLSCKIDKNYIKKQVETFQKMNDVPRRQNKIIRPKENSSLKLLEAWEKIMDEQPKDVFLNVPKRKGSLRKSKKIVSSTVESFLDNSSIYLGNLSVKSKSFDSLLEETEVEAINEKLLKTDLTEIDTKPRIVDVVLKKGVNGTPS